jgi:hypothetical protein
MGGGCYGVCYGQDTCAWTKRWWKAQSEGIGNTLIAFLQKGVGRQRMHVGADGITVGQLRCGRA